MIKSKSQKSKWIIEVLKQLKLINNTSEIEKLIYILENSQGYLTDDSPIKIFFYSDLEDKN